MFINRLARLHLRDNFDRIRQQSFEAFDLFHQVMDILLLAFELRMVVILESILELFLELLRLGFIEETHFLLLFVELAIVNFLFFILNFGYIEDRS